MIRGERGKLPKILMPLSVKSIASRGCSRSTGGECQQGKSRHIRANKEVVGEIRTPATPRFSMAGILCPVFARSGSSPINSALLDHSGVVSVLFKRTSEIEFALL